ncbi:MAG: molybdopterin oxidoreductase family protein [Bacteroidia bacterium]|nr:molybdopterin oxidoreductase family protein [Bacteroidia bacterium]
MESTTKYRTCPLCEAMCGLAIEIQDNKVLSIKGDQEDPFSRGHICPKAVGLKDIHEDPDRLKQPVKKTIDGWKEISWEAAFDEVTAKLQNVQAKYGKDAVGVYQGNPSIHNLGTTLTSPGFVRSLQTKNRYSATSVDQLPHHFAGLMMFGHSLLLPIPDIDRTDFWLILGGNPLVSNGSIMTAPDIAKRMRAISDRGGKVVVIDPRRTETARKADQHHFIKPNTDVWLLLAMTKYILDQDKVNLRHLEPIIDADELAQLKDHLSPYSLQLAATKTGIVSQDIQQLFDEFISAKSAVCYGRLGVSVVEFGGLCHWAINLINILTGNLDHPGGAMFTSPAFDIVDKRSKGKVKFNRWQSRVRGLPEFGGELPSATLAEEILTPGEGQIRAMVTSCGNPVLSTPNGSALDKALESLEFMVSVDIYINETTKHADIILPPATGLEVPHYDVSFHMLAIRNTSKYSAPVFAKEEGAKYDYEIFQALTKRMISNQLPEEETARANILMQLKATPEMALTFGLNKGGQVNFSELKGNPHGIDLGPLIPCLTERIMTIDDKLHLTPKLFIDDLERLNKEIANTTDGMLLIGRRHLRSNNSWMHNSYRLVKGPERCTMLIHPKDAASFGITNGQQVAVQSKVGQVEIAAEISDEIMPGVISIPHGWGHHRPGIQMSIAKEYAGVSVNDLTDHNLVDALTGNAAVNGVPVRLIVALRLRSG